MILVTFIHKKGHLCKAKKTDFSFRAQYYNQGLTLTVDPYTC